MIINTLFIVRVPEGTEITKVISCAKYGNVAITMQHNGNEITFFNTDFLNLDRVAWYDAIKFSNKDFHEEVPEKVLESIKRNGGFFLSKHFMTHMPGGKIMACEGLPIQKATFEEAKGFAQSIQIPLLKSDLMYGVIYDILGKWLIETETLTEEEWLYSPKSEEEKEKILTRDCGGWNLKELLGDIFVNEWTQERYGDRNYVVTRHGMPWFDGEGEYPARMRYTYADYISLSDTVIRAFMYYDDM